MPQSQSSIRKFMEQYPFLVKIRSWASRVGEDLAALEKTSIRVERADANLMFRIPSDQDCYGSFIRHLDKPWIGSLKESFYAVNRQGEPGNKRDLKHGPGNYVRDLFNRPIRDWLSSGQDPFETIQYVVWVSSTIWRVEEEETDFDNPTSKPVSVSVDITVFREPKEGWMRLYVNSDPLENVILRGSGLWPNSGVDEEFREVANDRLSRLAIRFDHEVVRQGLWPVIDRSRCKGMSGQLGDVKIITYVVLGGLLIRLERGATGITFRGVEDEKSNLGFSSIQGMLPDATSIVTDASAWWARMTEEERSCAIKDNPRVNMGI